MGGKKDDIYSKKKREKASYSSGFSDSDTSEYGAS
jgi:hypothetical protein